MFDERHMRHALHIAERGLGVTFPNPSVGCVLVKGDVVIGRGVTAKGGRPHAEVQALAMAGNAAKGATAYVTLEPCAHFGHTSPCASALAKASVARVVIGTLDPDVRVASKGVAMLKTAGIEVLTGVCEEQAKELHKGHMTRVQHNRPYVTLKMALSKDGFIAPNPAKRVQISGERAARYTQDLRVHNDAIMVGSGTYLIDKPRLDVRIAGLEGRSPLRVIQGHVKELDGFWVYNTPIAETLQSLAERGITTLLVEGGAKLANSMLEAGLVDEIHLIISKEMTIGNGLKPFEDDYLIGLHLISKTDLINDFVYRYM